MIGTYLFDKLSNDAAVTALVGTSPVRIFPIIMPQRAEYPAVVYSCAIQPVTTAKGEPADRDMYQVQIRIWAPAEQAAEAYTKCEQIDAAIRSAIDSIPGTAAGVTVDGCEYAGGRDGTDDNLEYFYREANYNIRLVR